MVRKNRTSHGSFNAQNNVSTEPGQIQQAEAASEELGSVIRISAKGLASQRKRLGLSAAEMGVLLGVSGQSVYKWEQGTTRPRAGQMPAIAALRKMGRKEATFKLAASET